MDKRIIKSNQKIKQAYIELLMKHTPNKIQIKDLCKLADINRSTFYDRYGYLDNLESEIIEEEIRRFSPENTQLDQLKLDKNGIDKNIIKEYVQDFCQNKILTRFCSVNSRDKYIDLIAHKQIQLCASSLTKIGYYEAFFQCLGALTLIIEWMNDHKNYSIDDIVDIIHTHSIAMFTNSN